MNYGYIYKTTCLLNNKIYVGKRNGDFDKAYLGSGILLTRAVQKYGKDNFAVIMIGQAVDKESLNILERYYIAFYRKQLPKELIYNIADGGDGGIMPPEAIEKIRQASIGNTNRRGTHNSKEQNENHRITMTGRKYS